MRAHQRVRDLHGKYSFSNDIIFNESSPGRLGVDCPLSSSTPLSDPSPSSSRVIRVQPRVRSTMGQAYDEVLCLKEFRRAAREQRRLLSADGRSGGAVGALGVTTSTGGVPCVAALRSDEDGALSHSLAVLDAFYSLIASSSVPDSSDTFSLPLVAAHIVKDYTV